GSQREVRPHEGPDRDDEGDLERLPGGVGDDAVGVAEGDAHRLLAVVEEDGVLPDRVDDVGVDSGDSSVVLEGVPGEAGQIRAAVGHERVVAAVAQHRVGDGQRPAGGYE